MDGSNPHNRFACDRNLTSFDHPPAPQVGAGGRTGNAWAPTPRDVEKEKKLFAGQMKSGINFEKYASIPIETAGNNVPFPMQSFETSTVHPLIKANVILAGYSNPTPVQKHAVPIIDGGQDLMACAQTGSGKTAAFLLPILSRNFKDGPETEGPRYPGVVFPSTLILAPTRELAMQIANEAKKFTYRSFARAVVVYGGTPINMQLGDLERGCHLLIATPGRLCDLIERRRVSLSKLKYLVLDEADRMLDMGFEPQIRRIVEEEDMPRSRQTLLFSATFPREIQILAKDFLRSYVWLAVGRVGGAADDIAQTILQVSGTAKRDKLVNLIFSDKDLRMQDPKNLALTLVFVQTKRSADTLTSYLREKKIPATSIHGDRSQAEREAALASFRAGRTPVMIATDVAARGLDVPNVTHVINYDLPGSIDDYVHRIGRTGRAGNIGRATAFYSDTNFPIARALAETLRQAKQPVPDFLKNARFASTGGSGGGGGSFGFGNGGPRRNYGEPLF
ncbi:P-loop containing nucleoside triphosphate hydrolase protein [Blyttiomyces helicus]|uniref:ATP-dependent RNA helicase DED1 n=1 Tax=Blyttiomyces helicus TaxID=388810 RepID=A0A4V1IRY9_9FUNG|nr:P-loop containing nucleoside triphosphate hydrolase protein [Blyttiomyces helicus]|eukprot:RKO91717.1 P-loop containing nucleoside triphosphate hydrolase protein [Blyttiomyces helicus]